MLEVLTPIKVFVPASVDEIKNVNDYTLGIISNNKSLWLKEQESFVFSKEELTKLLEDAFEAGKEYEFECHFGAIPPRFPNKEKHIKSILP